MALLPTSGKDYWEDLMNLLCRDLKNVEKKTRVLLNCIL